MSAWCDGVFDEVLYHSLRLDFCNQVGDDFALVLADIHEVLLLATEFVNGLQDFGGVSAYGLEFWEAKDIV